MANHSAVNNTTSDSTSEFVSSLASVNEIQVYFSMAKVCGMFPLGIVGCILTILVMSRASFGNVSYRLTLIILAVADCLRITAMSAFILADFLKIWKSSLFCQFGAYFQTVFSLMSDNTVMMITLMRTVSVFLPHKVHIIFSVRTSATTNLVVILCSTLVNVFVFYTWQSNGQGGCTTNTKYYNIHKTILSFHGVNLLINLITAFISAVIIGKKLRQSHKKLSKSVSHTSSSSQSDHVSRMLFSIAVVFLISTVPILVFRVYVMFVSNARLGNYVGRNDAEVITDNFVILLKDLGHASNFYVYCMSSSAFRNGLKQICFKK